MLDQMSGGSQRTSTGSPAVMLAGVALVALIIVAIWYFSGGKKPASPSSDASKPNAKIARTAEVSHPAGFRTTLSA